MVDIPPEIVSDILRRLPAKSLCRFKTVSKSWLSLISQPQFHKHHLNTVKITRLISDPKFSNPGPICTLPLNNQETPKLTLCSDKTDSIFLFSHGSCNGLVLGTAFFDYGDNKSRVFDHLVILNPTTKEYVKLSETDYETFENFTDCRCGIGYDSVTDDYKVVTLAYYHTRNRDPSLPIYVHVYSLKTNTWRRLADYPYPYDHYNDFINQEKVSGVLVNGCLHWIATKLVDNVLVRVIVGFSLADETFNEVPSPDVDILSNKRICKLGAFDEKLGIFVGDGVWLMKDYGVGDSWSKITINGFDETSNMSNISYVTPVIHFEDGKIMLVSDKFSRVYDVEEEFFIKSVDISRDIEGIARCTYVESLVSLKSSARLTIHRLTSSHGIEPATPQAATGSKTVFMGNLSYSIKENDIKKFFKDAGEVVEIRFSERDGRFAGYGHVEFATQEAAKKALELNGESLLDRKVKLDMVKERGPGNGSAQKSGQSKRPTIFVSGFGTDGGFDTIRSTLEEHFGQCGQISRMSIPKDFESGEPKGIAFIDFSDSASLSKALEISGTEVAGGTITVEEAKPRDVGRGGGRGRSGGRGVSRDGGTSGGRGRSDGRGRFGGGGRDGGRGGRGHGGHGSLERPDVARLAETARISLTPQEAEEFAPKIQQVVDWFGQLQDVDLHSIEQAIRPDTEAGSFREDTPETFDNREAIIAAIPSYEEPYIKVPKVLNKD